MRLYAQLLVYAVLSFSVAVADPASSLLWTHGAHGTPGHWARHGQLKELGLGDHHAVPADGEAAPGAATVLAPGLVPAVGALGLSSALDALGLLDRAGAPTVSVRPFGVARSLRVVPERLSRQWLKRVPVPPPRAGPIS